MSMHLVGHYLTTTGKKKGRQKFRNSDSAQKSRALKSEWEQLLERHGVEQQEKKRQRGLAAAPYVPPRRDYRGAELMRAPSVTAPGAGVCAAAPAKVYTGDKMLGIATMHKSNMVPVFSAEEAVDISKMRRG